MKVKSLPVTSVKAGPDDGLKEGQAVVYAATFTREPDSYGDVIAKGAFAESIQKWKDSGDVLPGMYLHDPNQIVAGAAGDDIEEDEHGLKVTLTFDEDEASQRIYRLAKGRRLSALSFAFNTLEEGAVELDDGRKANELRKLDLLEVSLLPKGFAANADTSVVAVKAYASAIASDVKAGRVLAQKHIDSLRSAQDAIGAVIEAAEAINDQEGKASGTSTPPSDASDESFVKSSASGGEPEATPSVDSALAVISIREKGVA